MNDLATDWFKVLKGIKVQQEHTSNINKCNNNNQCEIFEEILDEDENSMPCSAENKMQYVHQKLENM